MYYYAMATDRSKIEELLRQLPEELQDEVLEFAKFLLHKSNAGDSGANGAPPVRSFFGIWDSGDPRSGDNHQIDSDLVREYESSHEADS